jgi:putative Mg2+ transporter-C (MgtC) family protein
MQSDALSVADIALRLVVATLLGATIGWEREYNRKPAGLRTHTLVALGSATFMLLSLDAHFDLEAPAQAVSLDPNRVLQGVVGGIGFLGAGSILQSRGQVSGLTTAASVWVTGALGAGAGLGSFALVGMATAIGFIVLTVLQRVEASMTQREPPPPDA